MGAAARVEAWMAQRHWNNQHRQLLFHYGRGLKENVMAVLPITALLWVCLGVFFRVGPADAGLQVAGLLGAILGLLLFVDGLRVCVMPLGEMVGTRMPAKFPLPVVLLVSGFLGVLVTYAEPAIASLRPLAQLVKPQAAPYLYLMLNQKQELMVMSIGLGVGCAAVLGTLRFVRGWSLKPMIAAVLLPNIAATCYMQWGNPDLRPLIGLAWDSGAVTTGPVTVPILLAMGIGVMTSKRQAKLATLALEKAVTANEGQALEGFGIVTLASLMPILAVQIMAIVLSLQFSQADILAISDGVVVQATAAIDKSPLREVVFALRSILPLNAALIGLILFVLREPLPQLTVYTVPLEEEGGGKEKEQAEENGKSQAAEAEPGLLKQEQSGAAIEVGASQRTTDAGTERPTAAAAQSSVDGDDQEQEAQAVAAYMAGRDDMASIAVSIAGDEQPPAPTVVITTAATADTKSKEAPPVPGPSSFWDRHSALFLGILMCLVGMILFNLGLTYGFTALGDQAGSLLPGAYKQLQPEGGVPTAGKTPYYDATGGIILVLFIILALGFLATRAEPALNVLGRTVQHLSKGSFSAAMLIYAVSVGVGVGMAAGSCKILFGVDVTYWILAKYAVACTLTCFSSEDYTNIAWDSAGVTTGPVTVPFVLSIGIGFSKAVNAKEGFGILTTASVAPIISVLAVNMLRIPAQRAAAAAREGLARASASLFRTSAQPGQPGKSVGGSRKSRSSSELEALARSSVATIMVAYEKVAMGAAKPAASTSGSALTSMDGMQAPADGVVYHGSQALFGAPTSSQPTVSHAAGDPKLGGNQ